MDAGLALSGGGIRGAAHVGAIRALEENGINITAVSGTSAGSIVASLYAMGYKEDEIIKLFRYFSKSVLGLSPKNFFSGIKEKKGIGLGGITSSYNIENAIKEVSKLKGIKNIQDIQMPIAIPTTDLLTEKEYVFTNSKRLQGKKYIKDIEIGKAVRASSCFPGMYSPFEYKEFQFVDGGVFDNLPVKEAKRLTDSKIIAIKFKNTPLRKQKTVYNIAMHSLDLMNEVIIKEALEESDYVLEIDLKEVKPFSISKIDFCYKEGYMQTVDNISKIKKCLKS